MAAAVAVVLVYNYNHSQFEPHHSTHSLDSHEAVGDTCSEAVDDVASDEYGQFIEVDTCSEAAYDVLEALDLPPFQL
jgi:hypothetical protein